MGRSSCELWQISLCWAGEVVAVEQHQGAPGAHPFVALAGGVTLSPGDHSPWRAAARSEVVAVAERLDRARWPRRPSWARLDGLAALVTAGLLVVLWALSMIRPPQAPVVEARTQTEREIIDLAVVLSPLATIDTEELVDPVVQRAVTPVPVAKEDVFRARPATEFPLWQTGDQPQDHDRLPVEANPSAEHAHGLLDVERDRRVAGTEIQAAWYTVQPGDTLEGIARRVGLNSYLGLYTEGLNPELMRQRRNPHQIFPGDRVRVPR